MARSNSGQSLIELLVALGVAVSVVMMALGIMRFLIRLGANDPVAQTGALIARKASDAVSVAALGSWPVVAGAVSGVQYHIATSTNGFTLVAGAATSTVNGVVYTNYITVDSVARSATDTIVASGGSDDPATKKVTAVSSWAYGGSSSSETIEIYVARTRNESMVQTDWSGGPTCPARDPVIAAGATPTQFCQVTAGGLDYSSVPGSLRIQGH
jgi:hypothetical protein